MSLATDQLDQDQILYHIHEYQEDEGTAEEAAHKLGWSLGQIVKTLVVKGKRTGFHLILVPGDRSVDWSQLAKQLGDRKVHLASPEEVTAQTGYIIGSVSPIATTNHLPVIMTQSVLRYQTIGINGGQRGLELEIAPAVLKDYCQAQVMPVCK